MSIFINGMQLPKDEVAVIIYSDGDVRTEDWTKYSSIEVPPHGRLVDADALLKLLDSCMFPSDMVTTRALSMATNWLKKAQTVIPADKDGET